MYPDCGLHCVECGIDISKCNCVFLGRDFPYTDELCCKCEGGG